MIRQLFIICINLSILFYYYINKKYYINTETMKGLIIALYYIYWLSANSDDSEYIKNNIKLGCQSIFNACHLKLNIYGFKITDIPIIYVSNHNSYIDSVILKYLLPHIYTIAKDDVDKDFFLSNILKHILKIWNVILYKRGNKKSGKKVRKLMKKHINKGNSILVYPEGKAIAIGGPSSFCPGSFEVAYNNNFLIQPITIKYSTDITWGIKNKYSKKYHINMMRNVRECQKQINNVHITFHPIVNPTKFKTADNMRKYCEIIIIDEWINQHHYTKTSI